MYNFFVKSHGLGNEYIVLDSGQIAFDLTQDAIRKICNVHYGIGSDGILLKIPSDNADFGLRIFNPDGGEAEKSGNGLRIFAKYLYDYRHTDRLEFTIETLGGVVTARVIEEKLGKACKIRVDIGKANFIAREVPVLFDKQECFSEPLQVLDKTFSIHCVSVGNPHCVILCDEISEEVARKYGPLIEKHPMFPNRINVQFVRVISENEADIQIWERGAGYTLASGSSSSAVASVLVRKGLVNPHVSIHMPGGILSLEVDKDWNIRLSGEVSEIAYGTLSDELVGDAHDHLH